MGEEMGREADEAFRLGCSCSAETRREGEKVLKGHGEVLEPSCHQGSPLSPRNRRVFVPTPLKAGSEKHDLSTHGATDFIAQWLRPLLLSLPLVVVGDILSFFLNNCLKKKTTKTSDGN